MGPTTTVKISGGGRGADETARLRKNVDDQLNRLMQQLSDLDEAKLDMDKEEYESAKNETIEQLKEFEQSLGKMISGDMSLVDEIGSVQLALQSAVRLAFKSPVVLKMFAKKENSALRSRLSSLDEDLRRKKIDSQVHAELVGEILVALEKLGETLSAGEQDLLERYTKNLSLFTNASETVSSNVLLTAKEDTKISQI